MSQCLDIVDFAPFQRGTLDEDGMRRIREHLSGCAACRSSYDQFRNEQAQRTPTLPTSSRDETIQIGSTSRFDAPQSPSGARYDETTHVTQGSRHDHNVVIRKSGAGDSSPTMRASRNVPNIDGYQITGRLGQGGMGVVYRAVQTKLDRIVALKVLPAIVADGPAVERFRREAKSAARLHHTNIVPIYDFGESHDGHYYAMELIEGRPLNELIQTFATQSITTASPTQLAMLIRQGTMGVDSTTTDKSRDGFSASSVLSSSSTGRGRAYFRQVARWMMDAAAALHYAHGQGIIHRDIKPGNMILSADGRIMITDFGLAKTQDDTSISVVGALIGAIRYLSPEQAMAGRVKLDHRTDIWSLGATLYELLTFVPAFPGTDENQILTSIITKEPTLLRKIDPYVPAELETICLKTLEKDADHRYATAQALAEDLQRWLSDEPIVAKRPGHLRRLIKYAKRNRAVSTAVISGLLMLGMVWGFMGIQRSWHVSDYLQKAKMREKEGELVEAEQFYRKAHGLAPNNAGVLEGLSRVLLEQYDRRPFDDAMVTEAVAFAERAKQLDPTLLNIDNTYGVLLSMAKRFDDAHLVFQKDLPTDGSPAPHLWSNIAAIHFLNEKDSEALEALNRSIEKPIVYRKEDDGNIKEIPYFHGYHELATFQLMRRDPAALATIEKGIELQPGDKKHFGFYLVKARILLTLPGSINNTKANTAADAAKSHSGEKLPDRYIERYLALSQLRLDEIDQARASIERARTGQDQPYYTDLLLALAEAKSGNADLARTALAAADEARHEELKKPDGIIRSRHLGMIWFESADELDALRKEVETLLAGS